MLFNFIFQGSIQMEEPYQCNLLQHRRLTFTDFCRVTLISQIVEPCMFLLGLTGSLISSLYICNFLMCLKQICLQHIYVLLIN